MTELKNHTTPGYEKDHFAGRHSQDNVHDNVSDADISLEKQSVKEILPQRKPSLAQSLTRAVYNDGHDKTTDEDVYIGMLPKEKKEYQAKKQKNIRAGMNCLKLVWFDFSKWFQRWKAKEKDNPLFKMYIKNMESNFGSGIGSVFIFTRWIFCLNAFLAILWLGFIVLPTAVTFTQYQSLEGSFAFKNLIDGKGIIGQLWLFYGAYTEYLQGAYPLSLVYLLLLLVTYYGNLIIILRSIAKGQQPSQSAINESRFRFSLLLWTSWDHSITSGEAAGNLTKGIISAFKDNIYEAKASDEDSNRSKRQKYTVFALRTLAWFITIILIGGGCTAIVFLVIYVNFNQMLPNQSSAEAEDFLSTYGTTIIFSLINIFVPMCIGQLPKIEKYTSGRYELNVTLARVFFLRMANLFALIASIYSSVTSRTLGCTGTVIGQELYKLVIMDTLINAVVQLSMNFASYFWKKTKAEFSISSNVLVLIYRQGLVWIGSFACPVMPVLGMLSSLVFFFMNYLIISKTCRPPIKRWNQSRNTTFFMTFLLTTLAFTIIPAAVVIGNHDIIRLGQTENQKQFCGPFGGLKPTSVYTEFSVKQTYVVKEILRWFISDTVVITLFCMLLAIVFYLKIRLSGEKRHGRILIAELKEERDENKHLVNKMLGMGINLGSTQDENTFKKKQ
ncbi:hypothetical protein CHS0354_010120 [Potamilus streckersoni]|uniref:TMC domain-containing protein n=1 Tax=Potamilus streckersoni TaxID=2493646 RepID=A0AAE0RSF1_9BIVA|nr:hypothetical protein CHS0354_010120 [Potamilus streckersoni]